MSSIFTKILAGEMPGHFIYKDDVCFSILTIQPINPGHALVIPNEEVNHWLDLDPMTLEHLMKVAQKVGKAIHKAYPAKKVGMMMAGLEVPHVHIHMTPINELSDMNFANQKAATPEELEASAKKIVAAMEH